MATWQAYNTWGNYDLYLGPGGYDDLSYIALDAHYAHMAWGDRRNLPKVKNAPGGIGGVQAYYGRVPFSLASRGAPCGR